MASVLIEAAEESDYDGICEVLAEVDRLHVERTPDVFRARTGPARPREWLLERIGASDRALLVARDGDALVGVVEVLVRPPRGGEGFVPRRVAVIDDVAVREPYRGRGIGRALLEAARQWAASNGAEAVQLHVWSWNERARSLYERLGFVTRSVVMEVPL